MSDPAMFPSNRGGYQFPNSSAGPEESERPEETHEDVERTLGESAEATRAELRAERAALRENSDSAPYTYGPPASAPRETNYISDESLMLWLAQKQQGLYGDLAENMDMSRDRSKLIEDLGNIKQKIDGGTCTPAELSAELEALRAAYADTPFQGEIEALVAPMLEKLDGAEFAYRTAQLIGIDSNPIVKDFSDGLQNKMDALGRDDQLALIQIQSLTADIREAAQLASNVLSSSNQAANAIVGNIAR